MDGLFDYKGEITGNLAKVQVLEELSEILSNNNKKMKILDVGCVGIIPFEIWTPLLSNSKYDFDLYGVDIQGIEKAKEIIKRQGWKNVQIMQCSGYDLSKSFQKDYFDIIVSTQVLEHIKYIILFLKNIYDVAKEGGIIFLTLDSAHYPRNFGIKRLVMRILDFLGKEKYHNIPLHDYDIEQIFDKIGLKVIDKRFYNINPLKEIHNHKVSSELKNNILQKWKNLEDLLNKDIEFINNNKNYFMGLYYKLKKV